MSDQLGWGMSILRKGRWAISWGGGCPSDSARVGFAVLFEDAMGELAVDELELAPGSTLQGEYGDAVDIPEATLGGVMNEAEGV